MFTYILILKGKLRVCVCAENNTLFQITFKPLSKQCLYLFWPLSQSILWALGTPLTEC